MRIKSFPFYKQLDKMDCGPSCLRMIAKYFGKSYPLQYLREKCYITREGVSLRGIGEAAEIIGFRTMSVKVPFTDKSTQPSLSVAPLPAIAHWNQNHFLVVYKVNKKYVWVADPAKGKLKLSVEQFKNNWISDNDKGILLLIQPTINFSEHTTADKEPKISFGFLLKHIQPYGKLISQLFIGLLLGTIFSLIFPFLTQSLVDIGIDTQNLDFIYLVLAGQIMIFISQTIVHFIQSWIMLHISVRVGVNLVADFLIKLMKLPIQFFDTKQTGDLLQRIDDHRRIESFLTKSSLSAILSIFNIIVFGVVLIVYSIKIFLIFLVATIVYLSWIFLFLKKRKEVDYQAFKEHSENQDALIEIITGMSEIKLQVSQLKRRWKWTKIQARLFRAEIKSLSIVQYQDAGALSINQLKDILITFIAAKSVLDGDMTLGMMLAIQYIIGQLNAPLQQLVAFIRAAQDAKISLERLSEIHLNENEEAPIEIKSRQIPSGDILIKDVSFQYTPISKKVLSNIDVCIPRGKITAIVGTSGSGKTTLIKLLLGFYKPSEGNINIDGIPLSSIYQDLWRKNCGAVMQEGFIFSDTIAQNIAESDDYVDYVKMIKAINTANITDMIEDLPLGFNTIIGNKGNGISQGQKQRILIARAVYKNPEFIFFDEATNALDANNERIIMNNLNQFFQNKTVIVVAHRLSTVKNADQLIVLENGRIAEMGNHDELTQKRGAYFNLVKNQLELGN